MARWFSIRPGATLKGRKFKGIRGWAGKPTHPPLTDIPIAAYVIAAAFDVISNLSDGEPLGREMFVAATYVFIAGYIVAVPAIITGLWDWWKSTPKRTQAWRTANWHGLVMATGNLAVIVNLLIRKGDFATTASTSTGLMVLSVAIAVWISYGATYGGSLVYDYAFNVEQDFDHAYTESEVDKLPGQG